MAPEFRRQSWKNYGFKICFILKLRAVHPTVISNRVGSRWKQAFLENSSSVFEKEKDDKEEEQHLDPEKLYAKIGKLELENDFLKKSLGKLGL